ncbi:MAG: S-layer homology domain-containing protein [Clostridiales bacterium]|nr:S-layer homology domain-containing protein [Clostridiales bacterium]
MKKIILIVISLLLLSSFTFAEMIDESYINLIFDNFNKYSEEQKKENADLLEVLFSSNLGLDLLYSEVIRTKSEALKLHGITEEELKKNIEILKGWPQSDRLAFLNAGVAGDFDTVKEINYRNKKPEFSVYKSAFIKNKKPIIESYNEKFDDLSNHWSKEYVVYLNERGIIAGKTDNSFEPDENIKKAEIVTLVMNVIISDDDKLPEYRKDITDIQAGKWYDKFMQGAVTLDIVMPNGFNRLNPENLSTREEVIDILIKSLMAIEIPINENMNEYNGDFVDFDQLNEQYMESMVIAINLGFVNGKGNRQIAPNDLITRGETAVVIKKMYEYILSNL